MLANGEIDEDEAEQLKKKYVTEMNKNLNTQESVVFFTFGNGANDEDRELYMISINDWIAASSGYDQTCNALDEDDVEMVFSNVPSVLQSSVTEYSNHIWYSGFNCKADGTGFKPQLFLDDTCNTFSPTLNQYYPFRKAGENYSTQVDSDVTKYMIQSANGSLQNSQSCKDSEFCDDVFEKSIQLATCEEAEDEKRHLEETTYHLEYDVASNMEDACPSIQTALNIDEEYEYESDDLEELLSSWSNTANGMQESDRRSIITGTTSDRWLYIFGSFAVLFMCIMTYLCYRTNIPSIKKKPSIDTDDASSSDTKSEPLVDNLSLPHSESDIVEAYSAIECTLTRKKMSDKSEKRRRKTNQFREYLKNSISKEAP